MFSKLVASKYKVIAEGLKAEETARAIEAAFKKVFPKSLVQAKFNTNFGNVVTVVFSLVDEKSKLPNGIRDNDPAYSVWQVYGFNKDGTGDKLEANLTRGGSFDLKPYAGSYMAMSVVKLGWRKKSGSPDQIVKHFADYAEKSKKVMLANVDNVYGSEEQKQIYRSYLI